MTFTFLKIYFLILKPFLFSLTTTNKISIDFYFELLRCFSSLFFLFKKSYCFYKDIKIKFNFYFLYNIPRNPWIMDSVKINQ